MTLNPKSLNRRAFLNACSCAGIASPLLPGILLTLAAQAQEAAPGTKAATLPKITDEMLDQAAELAGVGPFTAEQKKMMLDGLNDQRDAYAQIRALKIGNDVPPAYVFHPGTAAAEQIRVAPEPTNPPSCEAIVEEYLSEQPGGYFPDDSPIRNWPLPPRGEIHAEDLVFLPVRMLAEFLRRKFVTSLALTQMYIDRLKRYDAKLHFVITLTEERALAQAKKADEEIAAGKYRGPLHGIPWGAKDLLAVKGYPTTWGAGGFEHQSFDEDATVVQAAG